VRLRFGVLLAALVLPSTASAFCRTTTVAIAPDFQPSGDACWDQGNPLFWRNSCVSYSVRRSASRYVALEDATAKMAGAFAKWSGTSCPTENNGRSRVSIDVRDLGAVDCGDVGYDPNGPNQNVIVFRDDNWPHNDPNNTIALTTVSFNPDTGEIYDADMEINSHEKHFTLTDPVPPDGYDFDSAVTHEAGHFLGMAHSGDAKATMYSRYDPGTFAMRYLSQDDITGICTIYRPDGNRTVLNQEVFEGPQCDPTPRHGFTSGCKDTKKGCFGSSSVAATTPLDPTWIGVGIAAALTLAARRKRKA
jgi:hypothetical protein